MSLTNVDGLLTSVESGEPVAPREVPREPEAAPVNPYEEPEHQESAPVEPEGEQADDSNVDDYGNPKSEPKLYTEDEVNERINKAIRDRLRRGDHPQQQQAQQQQVQQQAQQDFKYDETSEQSWEAQLETFVERTLEKVGQKQQAQALQQREIAAQAEFETKLHSGMSKFNDFVEVVGSKPITDAMTVATRSMKDPAAFLYAAAKTQAAELERISKIPDPYTQIAEIGRLEERMRKVKSATNAPRPLNKTAGDMSDKASNRNSIDDKIRQHAKTKYTR